MAKKKPAPLTEQTSSPVGSDTFAALAILFDKHG